jgi:transposase-like protein
MDKECSINDIAGELDLTYKTVLGMSHQIREAIYQQREEWREALTGEVEADDVHIKGGQQGRKVNGAPDASEREGGRVARTRGLSRRGRDTYKTDRPLVVSWVERGERGGRIFEPRRSAGKKSLLDSALTHVDRSSLIDTDTWGGYRLLGEAFEEHRSVKHSERYVSEEGAHCNTAESEWSIFKPWWRSFRGIAKRHLYLYLNEYSFRRTCRRLSRLERTEAVMGFLPSKPDVSMSVSASRLPTGVWHYVHHFT